jgi:integrase
LDIKFAKAHTNDITFPKIPPPGKVRDICMAGSLHTKQRCPKCGGKFEDTGFDMLCKECITRPTRLFVSFYWKDPKFKRSKRLKIYSDKQGAPLDTYARAHRVLEVIRNEVDEHRFDPNNYQRKKYQSLGFEKIATSWLQNQIKLMEKGDLSPSYIKELKRFVNKRFIPYFQQFDVRDLKSGHIKSFYLDLSEKLSAKTRRNIMSALHKMLTDFLDDEFIEVMPKFPKFKVPEPSWSWADKETQDSIIQRIPNRFTDVPFINFMARHGVRPGEARAIQWRDVNLKEGLAVIRRSFSLNKLREFTKTKKIRIIPLHPETIKELKALPIPINREQFVFTKKGKPYSESWARKIWNKAKSELDIEGLKLYEGTRHSLASQAYNRGVPLDLIGEMLGHTNPKTTKRYSHIDPSRLISVICEETDNKKFASGHSTLSLISDLFGE